MNRRPVLDRVTRHYRLSVDKYMHDDERMYDVSISGFLAVSEGARFPPFDKRYPLKFTCDSFGSEYAPLVEEELGRYYRKEGPHTLVRVHKVDNKSEYDDGTVRSLVRKIVDLAFGENENNVQSYGGQEVHIEQDHLKKVLKDYLEISMLYNTVVKYVKTKDSKYENLLQFICDFDQRHKDFPRDEKIASLREEIKRRFRDFLL